MVHIRRLRGFTLLELLAVITIIGILATLAVVGITNATRRGRDARRTSDITNLKGALELFFQDTGSYPTAAQFTTSGAGNLSPQYINTIPADPKGGQCFGAACAYTYTPDAALQNYALRAQLENRSPTQSAPATLTTQADCGNVTKKGNGVIKVGTTGACFRVTND
jgi:general secretion pathway protein G